MALTEEDARTLEAYADLVILQGTTRPDSAEEIARVMGGSYQHRRVGDGGLTIVVRGRFQPCQGTADAWSMPLPAAGDHGAVALVALARVEGAGSFPLVALRMDAVAGPATWADWPTRVIDAGQGIATLSRSIGSDHAVIVGDFAVPPGFRTLAGTLRGAGLSEAAMPPTWPARLGPLPMLPVHRLDRLWTGRTWRTRDTRTLAAADGPRAGWATTLLPDATRAEQGEP